MILAINANASIDRVLFIDRFIPETNMRTGRSVLSVGGKGLDTAVVLKTLGAPVQAISTIAGRNGEALAGLLKERGIDADLLWLPGETRIAHVIVETDLNRHSHITTSGYTVTPGDCTAFIERILSHAEGADWAVMAGSLPGGAPAGLYGEITRQLHARGVRVLIDTPGLPALEALPAEPDILKMNEREFAATFQVQASAPKGWATACRVVMEKRGIQTLVLTCGGDGILAFTPQATYHAAAPRQQAVNAAGSGDAVSAALVYHLSLGADWPTALAWAAATSAAVVLTEATAECRMQDVTRLYPQVQVSEVMPLTRPLPGEERSQTQEPYP